MHFSCTVAAAYLYLLCFREGWARKKGERVGGRGMRMSNASALLSCCGSCTVYCTSLGDRDQGWKQLTAISLLIVCYLNFCIFNRPKKNSNSTQCIQGFLSRKNLFKFESKHKPQPVIWQSLQKAIPEGYCLEDNGRFSPAKWPSSWSSTQAQHWQVGLSSTNRQCFQVCISRCWPWQARLRKKCCHSWDTDLDLESKRFWCFVIFGQWQQIFFLIWNEIFDGLHDNLLSTKAALIASLNPLVFDWSLIKIGHRSKYACSVLNPVQSSRSK